MSWCCCCCCCCLRSCKERTSSWCPRWFLLDHHESLLFVFTRSSIISGRPPTDIRQPEVCHQMCDLRHPDVRHSMSGLRHPEVCQQLSGLRHPEVCHQMSGLRLWLCLSLFCTFWRVEISHNGRGCKALTLLSVVFPLSLSCSPWKCSTWFCALRMRRRVLQRVFRWLNDARL